MSGGGTMSERSARPRFTKVNPQMNTISKMIKTVTTAINGCGHSWFWPPD